MLKYMLFVLLFVSCRQKINTLPADVGHRDTSAVADLIDSVNISLQKDTSLPEKIVAFAKTQIGVRYKYCSMDPVGGFDCSGFVNYVFNHFDIKVPRSSVEFTNIGEQIALNQAKPGDLILIWSCCEAGPCNDAAHASISFMRSSTQGCSST